MKNHRILPFVVCFVLCAPCWTVYAQSPGISSARTAWEYKVITYVTGTSVAGTDWPAELYEDGQKLATPENGSLAKLQELGGQGWELVSVVAEGATFNRLRTKYYFKRPK